MCILNLVLQEKIYDERQSSEKIVFARSHQVKAVLIVGNVQQLCDSLKFTLM